MWKRRCLPRARTSRTLRPARSVVARRGTLKSVRTSTSPPKARSRRVAARWTVSPSGIATRLEAEAAGAEPASCGRKEFADRGSQDRLPVHPLDVERPEGASPRRLAHLVDRPTHLALIVGEREHRPPPCLQVRDEPAPDEHYVGAGLATGTVTFDGALGPLEGRAVLVCGIGRREHDRVRILGVIEERAHPVHRSHEREL